MARASKNLQGTQIRLCVDRRAPERETFPEARIRAFALVRTMGLDAEMHALLQPCRGEIRWLGNDAYRRP
jgi:hypothetical protein